MVVGVESFPYVTIPIKISARWDSTYPVSIVLHSFFRLCFDDHMISLAWHFC